MLTVLEVEILRAECLGIPPSEHKTHMTLSMNPVVKYILHIMF